MNCWHASNLLAAKIFSTNGHTYAIDSTGRGYSYNDYPTNTWTAHPEWGTVYALQYAGDGNLYALFGSCNSVGHLIGRWNGSGWTQPNGSSCAQAFSVDPQGGEFEVAIDASGGLWTSTNLGVSWVFVSGCGDRGGATSVAALNTTTGNFAVICHDNTIWTGNGSTYTQMPGAGLQISADAVGTLHVIGTDRAVYHWNGSSWDHIAVSSALSIADGGALDMWAIGTNPTGNNVFRFSESGLQHTRSISGSIACNVPPPYDQQICNPAVHTVTLTAGIGGVWGTQQQYKFNGPGGWSQQASANKNDIFDCLENGAKCALASEGGVTCSQAGQIFNNPPDITADYEWATTQVTWKNSDPPVCLLHFCRYKVRWACATGTTPPDYQIGTVQSGDVYEKYPTVSWMSKAFCFRFYSGTPWLCFVPPGTGDPVTWVSAIGVPPILYKCTHNP